MYFICRIFDLHLRIIFSTTPYQKEAKFVKSLGFTIVTPVGKLETLSERLKKVAETYNMSIAEFSRSLEIPAATMHGYINEDREPKLSFFQVFTDKFPDINIQWLISGNGNIFTQKEYIQEIEEELQMVKEQLHLYRKMDTMREENEKLKGHKH